eukprot:sb/3475881/
MPSFTNSSVNNVYTSLYYYYYYYSECLGLPQASPLGTIAEQYLVPIGANGAKYWRKWRDRHKVPLYRYSRCPEMFIMGDLILPLYDWESNSPMKAGSYLPTNHEVCGGTFSFTNGGQTYTRK